MNSAKLNDWIQIIGIASIVLSLIFVGYQIKQSHEIATAVAFQERAANGIEVIAARSQLGSVVEGMGAAIAASPESPSFTDLSAKQIGEWWFAERLTLVSFENNHYQWQAGYLSDEDWKPYQGTLIFLLKNNAMARYILENRNTGYRRSFRDYCSNLIIEMDSANSSTE